jgi:hypothetical protein
MGLKHGKSRPHPKEDPTGGDLPCPGLKMTRHLAKTLDKVSPRATGAQDIVGNRRRSGAKGSEPGLNISLVPKPDAQLLGSPDKS